MQGPSLFGGLIVYLVPLTISAFASVATLVVMWRGLVKLRREFQEHDERNTHA